MTKLAYFDCPTGIAGDMCLGAIVDAGVPLDYLIQHLNRLGISKDYRLWAEKVHRNGQQATKLHVELMTIAGVMEEGSGSILPSDEADPTPPGAEPGHTHLHDAHHDTQKGHFHAENHPHHHPPTRHLPEIEQMIRSAGLPHRVETWSLAIFRQLAEAEGAVHGVPREQVHFHEVGAVDAIVDIVGTCLGLDWLGVEQIFCSALPVGGGTIRAAHGRLPVPTPAVLKLFELRQVPLYSNGIGRELVTPTGAAIATTLATRFGTPPDLRLLKVGLGAGSLELPIPNILRLWIGESAEGTEGRGGRERGSRGEHPKFPLPSRLAANSETISVLETQIDDLNPQAIGYLYKALFKVGALDVFTQAIAMKKSRPGTLLTVIAHLEDAANCEAVIFRETTTLGIRRSVQQRRALRRESQTVQTEYGTVRVKVAWMEGQAFPTHVQPEYEDCAAIAHQLNIPWREIHRVALQAWYSAMPKG
jgi:uncharacterized protein (TIGR00299 family) protein